MTKPTVDQFAAGYGFAFDTFQIEACDVLVDGDGVLVAAPTGSGKTVVGEFACWLGIKTGRKCFYTTPIKALSNQKYHDLVARHGASNVGLLTGDTSINADAPIVVMTTEVLRNMIYAGSSALNGLGFVVMDEVHYLADKFRGSVWEEIILSLPESVQLICLSATVSNAEEFGDWLDEVRSGVRTVVWESRPVPLYQHVMVGKRLIDLFSGSAGAVNPYLKKIAHDESRVVRDDRRHLRVRRVRERMDNRSSRNPQLRARIPRRDDTIRTLNQQDLLPAIFFIFSRQGCDQAVDQMLRSDIDLTSFEEKHELMVIAEQYGAVLSDQDKTALGWRGFLAGLERGIASHHAGLLPVFKTIVEQCFVRGLIKVVFATETLALGINMPARTVVIEKLVKFNGESHVELTAGEFTQLAGRAGRRGIDTEGHAVVFWKTGMDPKSVATLASRRTYPLKSSFTPTYNMAVNLTGSVGRRRARSLLEQSFAQYQADKRVVTNAREAQRRAEQARELWIQAACELGDFQEYARLRHEISILENEAAKIRKQDFRTRCEQAFHALQPGDVFWIPSGKLRGWAVVIWNNANNAVVMRADHQILTLKASEINAIVTSVSKVKLPKKFDRHSVKDRRALARNLDARLASLPHHRAVSGKGSVDESTSAQINWLRFQIKNHPCHQCPDAETHARIAEQALRVEMANDTTKTTIRNRLKSIASKFERTCTVLEAYGYLDGDHVTEKGHMLARLYNVLDLVVAEAVIRQILDDLSEPQLAAVLSSLVYESRVRSPQMHRMPDRKSEAAQSKIRQIWVEISRVERDNRLDSPAPPDIGFAQMAYLWASGVSLATIIETAELPAGDFVRWIRQVIDLANQIAQACPEYPVGQTCRALVASMRRDIVDFEQT